MFTEGFDSPALRWVQEECVARVSSVPFSISSSTPQSQSFLNGRSGGRGFAMPPPAKFRSGYLPLGAIPVSQTIQLSADDSASDSDMDICSESEDEEFHGRELQSKKISNDDFPSAPPIVNSGSEINHVAEQVSTSMEHVTPGAAKSNGSVTTVEENSTKSIFSGTNGQDISSSHICDEDCWC